MKMDFNWESVNGLARALGGRVELLEKVFKEKGLTPAMIQKIVASGFASDFFDIGDEIIIPWTDYSVDPPVTYQVPHVVVHFGNVEDPDGNVHKDAMWLMWKYATPNPVQFDAPEIIIADEATFQEGLYYYTKSGSNYIKADVVYGDEIPSGTTYYKHIGSDAADVIRRGDSRWSKSAIRQWLNSEADKGEWWTPQHESDVASQNADILPGFLTGYEQDWLDVVKPITVCTNEDLYMDSENHVVETYDKFFIMSVDQGYGRITDIEGSYWEYIKDLSGLSSPSENTCNRVFTSISDPDGAKVICNTRTMWFGFSGRISYILQDGHMAYNSASANAYVLPSCVIY